MSAIAHPPAPGAGGASLRGRRPAFGIAPRFTLATMLAAVLAAAALMGAARGAIRARQREEAVRQAAAPRIAAARAAYLHMLNNARIGESDPLALCRLSRRWLEAELDAAGAKAERVAEAQAHLARVRSACRGAQAGVAAGEIDGDEFSYLASEAEFWVAREAAAE